MPAIDISPQSIKAIAAAVTGSSGSFATSSQDTSEGTTDSDRKKRANDIRYSAATKDLKTASKAFKDISNQQDKTADQIKKQVDLNSHFVSSAIEGMSKLDISAAAFDGLEDMFKSEEQLKIAHQMKDAMERLTDLRRFDPEEYDRLEARLADVGSSFANMGVHINDSIKDGERVVEVALDVADANEELEESIDTLSKKVKKDSDAIAKHTKRVELARNAMKGAAAGVVVAGKMIIDETRMAMRTATGDAQSFEGINTAVRKLRITTSEYQEILAKTRNVQHAVNQSGANFTTELVNSAQALTHSNFAGSAREAAEAAAGFMNNVTSMGVRFAELDKPMERQKNLYDKHFRGMSMSLDQFNQLTEDLLSDTDVRNDIARLDKQQRQAYIEGLQITTAENIERGYSIERAKELNKHFAKISGMNPLERLKKAAQERAMMGTLGMAQQGAELQQILAKLPGMEGPEKAIAQARAAEIRAEAANELKRRRGLGGGAEITYGMLADKLGYNEIANTFQTDAVAGRKFEGEIAKKQAKELFEVNETLSRGVWLADQARAGLMSGETALVFMAGSWLFSKGMETAMGSIDGKLTALTASGLVGKGMKGLTSQVSGGMMGGKGVGGARLAGGIGLALATIPYAIENLGALLESGGTTSPAYEAVNNWLGGKHALSDLLYDWFGDTPEEMQQKQEETAKETSRIDEQMNLQRKMAELQAKGVSQAERQTRAIEELAAERKAATAKQTQVISDAKRTDTLNSNGPAPG